MKSLSPIAVDEAVNGKSILITGGTGSFGRALVRTLLAKYRPARLVVFSRDELKQYEMQTDSALRDVHILRYFIGDVRDVDRLEMAFRDVDVVVHAAALKQVPTAEYNPFECIRTNVHGAENVVRAAIRAGVGKVVALSTDKAANPINLYGASKLASDKIFVAAKWLVGRSTHPTFAVVRYGNVVGSRGSVIPLYASLIKEGARSLPVTDERMTRFWITLQQGVEFVLSSLALMRGGEIFIPKIPSMKISDLARAMAPDLPVHFTGIRPGEKLHEVMVTSEDSRMTLELPDRFVVRPTLYGDALRGYHPQESVVAEEFSYASNTNDHWLSIDDFRRMVEGPHVAA
jgi:UDP-N-acetylglucosamine 4,6-dehydratase/5-epimerase